jgi:hypothetical protein
MSTSMYSWTCTDVHVHVLMYRYLYLYMYIIICTGTGTCTDVHLLVFTCTDVHLHVQRAVHQYMYRYMYCIGRAVHIQYALVHVQMYRTYVRHVQYSKTILLYTISTFSSSQFNFRNITTRQLLTSWYGLVHLMARNS